MPKKSGEVRFTVDLPIIERDDFQIACHMAQRSQKEVIRELMRKYCRGIHVKSKNIKREN